MRRACTLLTLLAAAVCAAPAAAAAAPPAGPAGDAFYQPPSPLTGKHGGLIWARRQTGPNALGGAARNDLLLYRSTSAGGATVAVSGSVAVPRGKAPKGGWPVIVYAHGTTGSADACAPTRGYDDERLVSYAYPLLRRWLKAGYAIVRTDYEGLGTPGVHPFLVGTSEGRSVLDAVRAARADVPKLGKRVVIAGHSQGAHAALFAAALAPKWAPDLQVRGTVALAPPSHLVGQAKLVDILTSPGGGLSAFMALILRGIQETTALDGTALLSDKAAPLYPQTVSDCYFALKQPGSFGGLAPAEIFRPGADRGPFLAALARSEPQALKIRTRVRIEQGAKDSTVFKTFTDRLVSAYEKAKVKVSYRTYPNADHAGVMAAAAKGATKWIRGRFGR
jgi:pimeloyl-ACP methyl ester carboxylesterase